MQVVAYTQVWNEAEMLPFYLNHYTKFCDKVIVYDNGSTDGSQDIVKSFKDAELREYDTGGTLDDVAITELQSNHYKEQKGKADFVIVCSCDEFLYLPDGNNPYDLRKKLQEFKDQGVTFPKMRGFSMLDDGDESIYNRLGEIDPFLYNYIKTGWENGNDAKRVVFNPNEVEVAYHIGSHNCDVSGNIVESEDPLFMLHYSVLGLDRALKKNAVYRERFSQRNRDSGYGFHRNNDEWFIENCYKQIKNNLKKVI